MKHEDQLAEVEILCDSLLGSSNRNMELFYQFMTGLQYHWQNSSIEVVEFCRTKFCFNGNNNKKGG